MLPKTIETWNNEILYGYPIIHIRKIMRTGQIDFLTKENVRSSLMLDIVKTNHLLKQLIEYGYIAENRWGNYDILLRGKVLAETTVKKIMTKKVADRKIHELIQRAKTVNKDPFYLYRITDIKIFGDYLKNYEFVKYLNFAVEFLQKEKDSKKHKQLELERKRASNRNFSNIVEEIFYPSTQILEYLKSGVHNITIQKYRDMDLKPDMKTIFETNA